uniref:DUF898 domain-containing protein n=1 Tax=Panagrellus redivivus TaxID=6233 RepID=A0A7E5A276_PANRE
MLGAACTGPLGNASPYSFFVMFGLFMVSAVMIFSIQITQFWYRLAVTYTPGHRFRDFMAGKIRNLYLFNFVINLFLGFMVLCPVLLNIIDPFEAQRLYIEDFPALLALAQKYPSMTGYHPQLVNFTIELLLNLGVSLSFIFPLVGALAVAFFIRRMKVLKATESKKTYDMHYMLYK